MILDLSWYGVFPKCFYDIRAQPVVREEAGSKGEFSISNGVLYSWLLTVNTPQLQLWLNEQGSPKESMFSGNLPSFFSFL